MIVVAKEKTSKDVDNSTNLPPRMVVASQGDVGPMVNLLLCESANTAHLCNMFAELETPA